VQGISLLLKLIVVAATGPMLAVTGVSDSGHIQAGFVTLALFRSSGIRVGV
jgi:hypothetical protein